MIEIQPVAIEAAIAHQQAITNASHLLSCSDYLIEALPEEVQELSVMADLSVLLAKVGDEISAARVKFETKEKPAPVAPWRDQQEQEQPQEEAKAPRPKVAPSFQYAPLAPPLSAETMRKHREELDREQREELDREQQARIYTANLVDQALQKELEKEANQAPLDEVGSAKRALNIAYGLGLTLQEEIDHLAMMAGIDCHHHAQHLAPAIHAMIIEALCQLSEVGEPATA